MLTYSGEKEADLEPKEKALWSVFFVYTCTLKHIIVFAIYVDRVSD